MQVLEALGMTAEELAYFTCRGDLTPIHVCRMGFAGEHRRAPWRATLGARLLARDSWLDER